jgi:hypothetical protein
LPPDTLPDLVFQGSPRRRPSVIVVSPPPNAGLVHSPLNLQLTFHAFGGATIDSDSIVVTYKKTPEIDISNRRTPCERICPSVSGGSR